MYFKRLHGHLVQCWNGYDFTVISVLCVGGGIVRLAPSAWMSGEKSLRTLTLLRISIS